MQQSNRPPDLSGPAVIHTRRGKFVATHAEISSGIVSFEGNLRVRDYKGERTYPRTHRSIKLEPGEWIEWLDREAVAA